MSLQTIESNTCISHLFQKHNGITIVLSHPSITNRLQNQSLFLWSNCRTCSKIEKRTTLPSQTRVVFSPVIAVIELLDKKRRTLVTSDCNLFIFSFYRFCFSLNNCFLELLAFPNIYSFCSMLIWSLNHSDILCKHKSNINIID